MFDETIKNAKEQIKKSVFISDFNLNICFASILTRGHILIEDTPGVGKTTLAKSIAQTLNLKTNRVQCTNDLLPADIVGYQRYDEAEKKLIFQKGPVFCNVLLLDEINRASPRTQSALLEVMEEQTVSIEGKTDTLPDPFIVIATQNPSEHAGTFPLPQSQLDRFCCKLHLGYPNTTNEKELLLGKFHDPETTTAILTQESLLKMIDQSANIHVSDEVLNFLLSLVEPTRDKKAYNLGISPRGSIMIKNMAQAWAMLHGRSFVTPDDVISVFIACCGHKVVSGNPNVTSEQGLSEIIQNAAYP